jgi:hypothetical protein
MKAFGCLSMVQKRVLFLKDKNEFVEEVPVHTTGIIRPRKYTLSLLDRQRTRLNWS